MGEEGLPKLGTMLFEFFQGFKYWLTVCICLPTPVVIVQYMRKSQLLCEIENVLQVRSPAAYRENPSC